MRAATVALLHEVYTGQIVAVYDGSLMEWGLDPALPVMAELRDGADLIVPPQSLDDSGMMLSRQTYSTSVPQIRAHIPAGHLPHGRDHTPQPGVGAALGQRAMPLLIQVDAPVHISPGARNLAIDLSEPRKTRCGDGVAELKGKLFQSGEDRAGFPHLARIQAADAESPAHVGFQHAFAGQPEESFPDRCPAYSQLEGNVGVADSFRGEKFATMDPGEDSLVDLVAQRGTGNHGRSSLGLHTVYNIHRLGSTHFGGTAL